MAAIIHWYFCKRGCGAKFLTEIARQAHEEVHHDKRKGDKFAR